MSVRAYLIKSTDTRTLKNGESETVIKRSGAPTFNCWHDWDIIEEIAELENYGENGGSLIITEERAKRKLKEIMLELKGNSGEGKEAEQLREWAGVLEEILKDIKSTGDDYAEYDCY